MISVYLLLLLFQFWFPLGTSLSLLCLHNFHAVARSIDTQYSTRSRTHTSRSSLLPRRRRPSISHNVFNDDNCSSNDEEDRKFYKEQNLSSQIAGLIDDTNFWSRPRNSQEIMQHVSRIMERDDTDDNDKAAQHQPQPRINVISEDLPLLTIHNFISNELCDQIIEAARKQGNLKRSTLGDDQSVSLQRTSSTTWLSGSGSDQDEDGCGCEEPIEILKEKASRISGIPTVNMENLQVVRYNGNGEKFDIHTDHLEAFNDLDCRGRLATCLVYLNSSIDADALYNDDDDDDDDNDATMTNDCFMGGETWFPEYAASVKPRRGTAVFWFNTVQRPGMEGFVPNMNLDVDLRSRHAGMPVFMNEKWVCNLWMHPVKQNL